MDLNLNKLFLRISGLLLFLISLVNFVLADEDPGNQKKINVIFRFDDYSEISNTGLEQKIIAAFRAHGIPLTVGVIPFVCEKSFFDTAHQNLLPLDTLKVNILKTASEEGVVEIALHGYSHQTNTADVNHAEFPGLSYDEQLSRIKKGKDYLEQLTGIPVTTFIPPWNRYDENTLKALDRLNFTTISASTIGIADPSISLKFVPNTSSLFQLKDAVDYARKSANSDPFIIVLFHSYDFPDSNPKESLTFSKFSELLDWTALQNDIRTMTINNAASKDALFSAGHFIINIKTVDLNLLIPPLIRPADHGIYVTESDLNRMWLRVVIFYLVLVLIILIITYWLTGIISQRLNINKNILKYSILALFVLVLLYTITRDSTGYKVLILNGILLGTLLGVWGKSMVLKSKNVEAKGN